MKGLITTIILVAVLVVGIVIWRNNDNRTVPTIEVSEPGVETTLWENVEIEEWG